MVDRREPNGFKQDIRVGSPDLRPAEGLLFADGDKKILVRVLDRDHISVTEIRGEQRSKADIIEFPHEEQYQHEIADGKVIFVYGGRVKPDGRRVLTYSAPRDVDVARTVPKSAKIEQKVGQ